MLGRNESSHKRLIMAVLLLGVLVAAAFLAGYLPRRNTTRQLDSAAAKLRRNTPPIVNAAKVTRAPNLTEVSFPGSITPITEAYIFARAAGYLKRRYVDIGDRVSAGQLLAEIDAPDLDQQVTQGAGCAGTGRRATRSGRGDTRTTDSDPRSCRYHMAEIPGPHEDRRGVASGRGYAVDGVQDCRSECHGRREERRGGERIRSRRQSHIGQTGYASRI